MQLPITNSLGERLDVSFHVADRSNYLVVLGHGLTGDKDSPLLVALTDALAENGWPSLRVLYSGNGDAEGDSAESRLTKGIGDLSAVIDQVGRGKSIAYIGHGMGGTVGILTAARDERIKVLVSLAGIVHTAGFVEREFSDTLAAARELRLPMLLLHGKDDDVVPISDSQNLERVLRGRTRLVEIQGADHAFEGHYSQVAQEVCGWLGNHLKTSSAD